MDAIVHKVIGFFNVANEPLATRTRAWLVETRGVEAARWVARVVGRQDRAGLLRGAHAHLHPS